MEQTLAYKWLLCGHLEQEAHETWHAMIVLVIYQII